MNLYDLDTPALVVDTAVMTRNLDHVATYAAEHGLRLRPHTKTHKIPALGRKQLDRGAVGLTVAKTTEAEVMLAAKPEDLLIAYPVVGPAKLRRLADVARKTSVTVALDSEDAALRISEAMGGAGATVRVLAEMDAGLHRVGVAPGSDLVRLAKCVDSLPGLEFDGIAFYPGHLKKASDDLAPLSELIEGAVQKLKAAGFEPRVVSGGSTPTLFRSHEVAGVNEIRPGTYIFNDRNTVASGACGWDDVAASMLVTVVSTAVPGQIIVDGGSKTFSSDRNSDANWAGFGAIVGCPEAVFEKMNEEHGFINVRDCDRSFRVGEMLRIVPNHICTAVNLHQRLWAMEGERVLDSWEVAGRGKLQ